MPTASPDLLRPARRMARREASCGAASFDRLEPRVLLTTHQFVPIEDALDLGRLVETIASPDAGSQGFGSRIVGLGDIDGDGVDDFAVSAPGGRGTGLDDPWTGPGGSVLLYSGRTRSLIRTLTDSYAGFGAALANAGDLNGDGVADLAVGSPMFAGGMNQDLARAGRVWIFSGADGTVIRAYDGAQAGDDFGWALANVSDIDGDGVDDLLVGAPGAGGAGRAFVFSGADGSVVRTLTGEQDGDRFGFAVHGGIDAPALPESGDGVGEFLIGAPGHDGGGDEAGRAYLIDGATGELRFSMSGGKAGDRFGHAVLLQPTSISNRPVLIVGEPGFDAPGAPDAGRVRLLPPTGDTQNFHVMTGTEAGGRLGTDIFSLRLPGGEFGITAPGATASPRVIVADHDRQVTDLAAQAATASWLFAADLDGDGAIELVAGAPDADAGDELRVLPSVLLGAPGSGLTASSRNGRWVVYTAHVRVPGESPLRPIQVLVRDGVPLMVRHLPGILPGDRVEQVSDSGLLVGRGADGLFMYQNGVRRRIEDAILAAPDGTHQLDEAVIAAVGANGDIVLNVATPTRSAYLLRAGTLRKLWDGAAAAVNGAGMVVGTRDTGSGTVGVALLPDGRIVDMPALGDALAVSDSGVVAGNTLGGRIGLWRDGALREALPAVEPPPEGGLPTWHVLDIDDNGRVIATATWNYGLRPGPTPTFNIVSRSYLFTPAEGFRPFGDVVTGEPSQGRFDLLADRITANGVLLGLTGAMFPQGQPGSEHGIPLAASTTVAADGVYLAAIGDRGEFVVVRRDDGGWDSRALALPGAAYISDAGGLVVYTDARDGRAYAVARTGATLSWFAQTTRGDFVLIGELPMPAGSAPIVSDLTSFTSADGRAHVAGIDAAGDLIVFYQTNSAAPDSLANWALDNLSRDHVEARGLRRPLLAGSLTSYGTPWGGMNIIGLDAHGQVQTVWWAPGLTLWTLTNLSAEAGTPALHGRLASMVTPWGGMTIVGSSVETGELLATWWAPGTVWSVDNLTDDAAGTRPTLAADSLTAYTTAWGGMNVAGRNAATGEVSVYWWVPGQDVWTAQPITVQQIQNPVLLTGPLTSATEPQSLNLFGREESGGLVRLSWNVGDGALWTLEDLGVPA